MSLPFNVDVITYALQSSSDFDERGAKAVMDAIILLNKSTGKYILKCLVERNKKCGSFISKVDSKLQNYARIINSDHRRLRFGVNPFDFVSPTGPLNMYLDLWRDVVATSTVGIEQTMQIGLTISRMDKIAAGIVLEEFINQPRDDQLQQLVMTMIQGKKDLILPALGGYSDIQTKLMEIGDIFGFIGHDIRIDPNVDTRPLKMLTSGPAYDYLEKSKYNLPVQSSERLLTLPVYSDRQPDYTTSTGITEYKPRDNLMARYEPLSDFSDYDPGSREDLECSWKDNIMGRCGEEGKMARSMYMDNVISFEDRSYVDKLKGDLNTLESMAINTRDSANYARSLDIMGPLSVVWMVIYVLYILRKVYKSLRPIKRGMGYGSKKRNRKGRKSRRSKKGAKKRRKSHRSKKGSKKRRKSRRSKKV
jgi:hypothetical protein